MVLQLMMGQLALEAPLQGLAHARYLFVTVQVRITVEAMTFKIASAPSFTWPAEVARPNFSRIVQGRRERGHREGRRRNAGWLCVGDTRSERNCCKQHEDHKTHDRPPVLAAHAGFVPTLRARKLTFEKTACWNSHSLDRRRVSPWKCLGGSA